MDGGMAVVAWSDSYALGLPEIDAQHRVLFDLLNELWGAIVDRAEPGEMLRIVAELEKYTISHFAAEETFMRVTQFPAFADHKKAHDAFVARILSEKKAIEEGRRAISLDLLHFLKDWLVNHILATDREYARHYANSRTTSGLGGFFKRFFRGG